MTNEITTVSSLSKMLEKMAPEIQKAIPKHLNPDRMARLALTAFSSNPGMANCTTKSIISSLMTASQLGLEPGVNGQGWLIPYKTTCTFVPGWKGMVDMLNRSGNGIAYTGVIYSDQKYTFTDGCDRNLIIHNETAMLDPSDITHAYAIGKIKGQDQPIIDLWPIAKIKRHRDLHNKQGDRHYSYKYWEMYARKIPLLQVLKYMPMSIELANCIAIDNHNESGSVGYIDHGVVYEGEQFEDEFDADLSENQKDLMRKAMEREAGRKAANENT
jgi:recombination protein RecT